MKKNILQQCAAPALCITTLLLASATASADTPVSLSGFLNAGSPSSFDLTALQNYATANPTTVQTVTVGGDTYTGVSLYSYLDSYIATEYTSPTTTVKNDILRDTVLATSASGASTVFALGNLSPSGFGNQNDIIAYQDSNGPLNAPSLIAPDGSSVYNLASLNVSNVTYPGAGAGGQSTSFTVSGLVSNPTTYTAANLPGSFTPEVVGSYTGVSLWNLLVQDGISTNPANYLNEYVIVTGTDNYQVVYSLEELSPQYGNQNDIVAYATNTGAAIGANGFARTIVPGDTKAGRWMSNLDSITVVSAVPVPGSAVLMLSGLLAIGANRLRKSAA
ncbi:MAG: hypothetical protein ABSB19_15070 [Methylomonas sp.]|jgi:hypothetical protein